MKSTTSADRRKLASRLLSLGTLLLLFILLNLVIFFVFTKRCIPNTSEGVPTPNNRR